MTDERTFIFIDLAGFTALNEAHGDERAPDLAERFVSVVESELGTSSKLVKRSAMPSCSGSSRSLSLGCAQQADRLAIWAYGVPERETFGETCARYPPIVLASVLSDSPRWVVILALLALLLCALVMPQMAMAAIVTCIVVIFLGSGGGSIASRAAATVRAAMPQLPTPNRRGGLGVRLRIAHPLRT